jgi:hypothetical protein
MDMKLLFGSGCYYKTYDCYWGDGWNGRALQWQDRNSYLEQTDSW